MRWPIQTTAPTVTTTVTTTGDFSPAIVAAGDVSVVQGFSAEQVASLVEAGVRGATANSASQIADLAGQLGATQQAVGSFLRILGEQQVPADQLLTTLGELSDKYRAAGARIAALVSDDAATQALLARAKAANEAGDYAAADRLLAEIEDAADNAAGAAQAELDARRLQAAEVRATRGLVAFAQLAFAEAADHFDVALRKLPKSKPGPGLAWLMLKAEALERHGARQGDNAALANAIDICDGVTASAAPPNVRLQAMLAAGRARTTLGARETAPKRLLDAVATFNKALQLQSRAEDPTAWAMTQMSLGVAFAKIGQRGAAGALQAAASAYTAALSALDAKREPARTVTVLVNFGAVLRSIGEREPGTQTLERALQAYNAALELMQPGKTPEGWVTVQRNLGNLHMALAERRSGTDDLDAAETCFRTARDAAPRARAPLDWAAAMNGIGLVLARRAERAEDPALLEQAADAFRASLEEQTAARDPQTYAEVAGNLGNVLAQRAELLGDGTLLDQAITAYMAARDALPRQHFPLRWVSAASNLGVALKMRAARAKDLPQMREAIASFRAALEECPSDRLPIQHATAQNGLGTALLDASRLGGGVADARSAADALRAAAAIWDQAGMFRDAAGTRLNLANALIAAGDSAEAGRVAGEAAALFAAEGMTNWAQRAEAIQHSCGGTP